MPGLYETRRRLSNLVRLGTVLDVDHGRARCRVQTDGNHTDWLPWLTPRAGQTIEWSAPVIGEQVIILSPEGVLTGAVVVRGLYCDAFPPPSSAANIHLTVYPDGARVQYDHAAHALSAVLPGGGTATVTASGGITLNGPLTVNGQTVINGQTTINGNTAIDGDLNVSQTITAQAITAPQITSGSVSLHGHAHTGVQSGPDSSGPPL